MATKNEARSRKKDKLTAERARELLNYNPVTGEFTWKVDKHPRGVAGAIAGHLDHNGYIVIGIDGRIYKAHRLAFLLMQGEWPTNHVDHKVGIRHDNRWEQIRPATRLQNCVNARIAKSNTSGVKGVHWHVHKWQARITINGKRVSLGHFASKEEAAAAYQKAAKIYYGDFARF